MLQIISPQRNRVTPRMTTTWNFQFALALVASMICSFSQNTMDNLFGKGVVFFESRT